jgi:hypothetical protein
MDSVELELGLGIAAVVDEIVILWPSGIKQTLTEVPVDQFWWGGQYNSACA